MLISLRDQVALWPHLVNVHFGAPNVVLHHLCMKSCTKVSQPSFGHRITSLGGHVAGRRPLPSFSRFVQALLAMLPPHTIGLISHEE